MKWLIVLFSIFKPFFSGENHELPNPVKEIKEMIQANSITVMVSFGVISALATIFSFGVVITVVDISAQYDQNANVVFSAMIFSGIALILLPIIIGMIAVKKMESKTYGKKSKKEINKATSSHPVQDALALLVADFVKEREQKRTREEMAFQKPISESHTQYAPIPTPDDFMH